MAANIKAINRLPEWVPQAVRLYLSHTEAGVPLRALARAEGCHPSTVLRRVRRYESRRDDPLVDEALDILGQRPTSATNASVSVPKAGPGAEPSDGLGAVPVVSSTVASTGLRQPGVGTAAQPDKESADMTATTHSDTAQICDGATIAREARRVLRRLIEADTILAVAPEMEKAVVLKETADGGKTRLAVVGRDVARAFALKDWIACRHTGRVAAYAITPMGRVALKRLLAEDACATDGRGRGALVPCIPGLSDAATPFADQHREVATRPFSTHEGGVERLRCNIAESPVTMLARRRDRDGRPFLNAAQVTAAERLREDFELAQMGPRVAQNWDRFLTGGARGGFGPGNGRADAPSAARERVSAALRDLGPGLGDVVLRCCCFLEGLEATERRMGWSARSGKIVLRIALTRLACHYDEVSGGAAHLIG